MTPIERAARAAKDATNHTLGGILPEWENTDPKNREEWMTIARAVLQAIREPSPRMLQAGIDELEHGIGIVAAWPAMIDAALEEG